MQQLLKAQLNRFGRFFVLMTSYKILLSCILVAYVFKPVGILQKDHKIEKSKRDRRVAKLLLLGDFSPTSICK